MKNIDISATIGAVSRELSTVMHDGRMARRMVAGRTYDASIDDVWDAITSPERLPKWFMPISGDLRPGGHYQLQGNASGTIERCDPPTMLHITWEYGGDVSWVHVTLSDNAGTTNLLLEHIAHVPDEFWNQYGAGAAGVGWDLGLMGLGLHLSTGEGVDPAEASTWPATAEGRTFVSGVSDRWCEASIASGTDPVAAREAADRTTKFYTGQE